MGEEPGVSLRAFAQLDGIGPQYAAYWGLMSQGALPLAGMSQLVVEVSPANAIFPISDAAFKAAAVRSAGTLIERDFGLLELHATTPDPVTAAGTAILERVGRSLTDRLAPAVASSQLIANVSGYHSQLINKVRRGTWTLPGETLFVIEVSPAAYAYVLAAELEKQVPVALVRCAGTGLFGRLIMAGSQSDAVAAERAAAGILADVRARAATGEARKGGG